MASAAKLIEDTRERNGERRTRRAPVSLETGPVYAAALAPDGRRFLSDEFNHRVVVEEPTGARWSFGSFGAGRGEFNRPRGLSILAGPESRSSLLVVCDAWNHRLQIFGCDGRWLASFGAVGAGEGQFDVPSDVAVVDLPAAESGARPAHGRERVLAVADRWNSRIQILDLQGRYLAAIGGHTRYTAVVRPERQGAPRAGWPFFRVGLEPAVWYPTRLLWQAPHLHVLAADGRLLRIDLAVAMLSDFDVWRQRASLDELAAARRHFRRLRPSPRVLPPDVLAQIDTDLGRALIERGSWVEAGRVWACPWPDQLSPEATNRHRSERVAAMRSARADAATCVPDSDGPPALPLAPVAPPPVTEWTTPPGL